MTDDLDPGVRRLLRMFRDYLLAPESHERPQDSPLPRSDGSDAVGDVGGDDGD